MHLEWLKNWPVISLTIDTPLDVYLFACRYFKLKPLATEMNKSFADNFFMG